MISCRLSIWNAICIIQVLLLQVTLGLALPTVNSESTSHIETRDVQTIQWDAHSKRALETSSIPQIAGGAVGIVAFGLIFGLGSASIAIFGSIEWQGYLRSRKEAKQGDGEKGTEEQQGKKMSFDSESEKASYQEKL